MDGTTVRLTRTQLRELDDALGESPLTPAIVAAMEGALSQYASNIKLSRNGDIWFTRYEIPYDQLNQAAETAAHLSTLIEKGSPVDDPFVENLAELRDELAEYAEMARPRPRLGKPVDKHMLDAACRLVYDLVDCRFDITVKTDTGVVEVLDLFRYLAEGLVGRLQKRRGRTSKYEFARNVLARYTEADLPHRSD